MLDQIKSCGNLRQMMVLLLEIEIENEMHFKRKKRSLLGSMPPKERIVFTPGSSLTGMLDPPNGLFFPTLQGFILRNIEANWLLSSHHEGIIQVQLTIYRIHLDMPYKHRVSREVQSNCDHLLRT